MRYKGVTNFKKFDNAQIFFLPVPFDVHAFYMLNASATASEEEYRRRYNDLTDRFRTEEEKHKRLTAERKRMDAESVAIGGMLFELTELEAPPIEFDEKLWHAVVDKVTVYNDDRLVYSLKDGSEITVMF